MTTCEIELLLHESGGVIRRRDHPRLARTIDHLVQRGRLSAILPGVYASADSADELPVRLAAVATWSPDAVVTGQAAAHSTFWPELAVDSIDVARRSHGLHAPGYRVHRRTVPRDWTRELSYPGGRRLLVTGPALTAVELSDDMGGEVIDQALRSRETTLAELHAALEAAPYRNGNRRRRRLLVESRGEPWGESERRAHRLLWEAGIRRWTGNHPVILNDRRYFVDICFRSLKLAIEIDGIDHARDLSTFQTDRRRQNALVLAGWIVLRFTWADLVDRPQMFIAQVKAALALARRSAR